MNVEATNKASGEVISLPASSFEEIVQAYRTAQEYEKTAKDLKDQLKKILPTLLNEQGRSEVSKDGYMFRQYETQRQNYRKESLRKVFDEDELDLFLEVSKSKVDAYLKVHELEPAQIAELKAGLEPAGSITKTTRLERVG